MIRRDEISNLEYSERVMADVAERVRDRVGTGDDVYRSAVELLHERVAEESDLDWRRESLSEEIRRELLEVFAHVEREHGSDFRTALRESHVLGWFHQYFGAPVRDASHRAHHRSESKHETVGVTTQLYTPRWIADVLARSAIQSDSRSMPSVLDPAVGGGQMLLAAYDALSRSNPDAGPVAIVGQLAGRDIDARAVDAARRSLALRAARHAGRRVPRAETRIERQIQPGDGLFGSMEGAEIVLTNPPYMGLRSMPEQLKRRIRRAYEPFHRDLYAAFIRRCHELADRRVGILAQQTIWYLKSYRQAREKLLNRSDLELFVHLGPHAFASLQGEKANVAAFVQAAFDSEVQSDRGTFADLRDIDDRDTMRETLPDVLDSSESERRFEIDPGQLTAIPGRPLAYWLPSEMRRHFDETRRLGDVAEVPGCQNKTGANREYVREWAEVDRQKVWDRPLILDVDEAPRRLEPPDDTRWMFYSKGGGYAPWWGNWQYVVDWSRSARQFYRENSTSNLLPERYRFREGICYTDFGGHSFNARWMPAGCLFDMAGPAIFVDRQTSGQSLTLFALLAVLNSTPVRVLLNAMNPSIHYQVTDLRRLPLPNWSEDVGNRLADLARANVEAARQLSSSVPESPVVRVPDAEDVCPDELARCCRRRERAIDRMVCELYGVDRADLDPEGTQHRYFPDAQ